MKELSIEEKAKAYDEAIKRAQAKMEEAKVFDYDDEQTAHIIRLTTTDIFPELKGSEDEMIRKSLSAYFAKFKPDDMWDADFSFGDIVAWLEKQGKSSVCKVKIGETYKCIASPRYTCFRNGDIYHVKDNFVAELINTCSDCFVLLEKQGEQKPVEWSKEDESMIGSIRSIIEKYAFSQSAVDVNGELCEKEFIDADNWLKSLRLQKQWKPDGDQLDALYDMIRSFKKESSYTNRDDIANVVDTLLEQLKAL